MAQTWHHVQRGVRAHRDALTARSARPTGIGRAARSLVCVRAFVAKRLVLPRAIVPGKRGAHSSARIAPGYHIYVRGPHTDSVVEALRIHRGASPWWSRAQADSLVGE